MYKVGDKVICIHIGALRDKVRSCDGVHLKVGKMYEVFNTRETKEDDIIENMIYIADGGFMNRRWCTTRRFMSLIEFRKRKLEKICTRLGIV